MSWLVGVYPGGCCRQCLVGGDYTWWFGWTRCLRSWSRTQPNNPNGLWKWVVEWRKKWGLNKFKELCKHLMLEITHSNYRIKTWKLNRLDSFSALKLFNCVMRFAQFSVRCPGVHHFVTTNRWSDRRPGHCSHEIWRERCPSVDCATWWSSSWWG